MRALMVIVSIIALAASVYAAIGDVISSFPFPVPLGGCEAVTWDGNYLWATGEGPNRFFCINTLGSVVTSFRLTPASYGYYYGAAFDGQYLWVTWCNEYFRTSFLRYTTAGSYVGGFDVNYAAHCGLTYENGYLWHGRRKLTTTGSIVASLPANLPLGGGLAWDGHYLWGSGSATHLYQISTTGSIINSFLGPNGYAGTGLTFDGNYLWLAGSYHYFYQIDIGVVAVEPGSMGKIKGLYR